MSEKEKQEIPLGIEVNECGFHVSRIISCLNASNHSKTEQATIDLIALARDDTKLKKQLAILQDELLSLKLDNTRQSNVIKEQADHLKVKDDTLKAVRDLWETDIQHMLRPDSDLAAEREKDAAIIKRMCDMLDNPFIPPPWRFCTKRPITIEYRDAVPGEVITTIEGVNITMTADHLVMRGTRGELYPITKAIFRETYEEVKKEENPS